MRLLVVEDDPSMVDLLRRALEREAYAVDIVGTGEEALWAVSEHPYDAVVLDVMIPAPDGFTVVRRLREAGEHVPVLMLTARDGIGDRVAGLDAGADDYLTKPFGVGELLARARAALRRRLHPPGGVFRFGDVEVDTEARSVKRKGQDVHLTPVEFRLLSVLIANAGKVLTHRHILREVWGPAGVEHHHYVRVYMGHLRQKLEDDPAQPRHLLTETAVGYRLVG
jgi:two-component system KDP operon response regulator KdpE